MKLLVDTDVFCKLGIANLLEEAARIFGASLQECGRLPALPFMLRRGGLRKLFGEPACDALIPIATSMPEVQKPDDTWLEKLTGIEAIGPGEILIFARAGECGLPFWSGDKRALRALKGVAEFIPALAGHVVVLEAILLALCDRLGHEQVRRRIAPLVALDHVVEICFSRENTDPSHALLSYYRALGLELTPLELWDPRGRG